MKYFILYDDICSYQCHYNRLSASRKKRADLLKSEQEKKKFVCSENITMDLLHFIYGTNNPDICGGPGEMPVVSNADVAFSRSYAEDTLCLTFDDKNHIGTDAEKIQIADQLLMEFFFTEEEKQYVAASPDKDFAFTLLWTRKESFMKYTGDGLNFSFNQLNTVPLESIQKGEKLFLHNDKCRNGYMNSYHIDDLIISVTSGNNECFPEFRKVKR